MAAGASFANSDGQAWPSLESWAHRAAMPTRTLRRWVKTLREEYPDELAVDYKAGAHGCNLYTFLAVADLANEVATTPERDLATQGGQVYEIAPGQNGRGPGHSEDAPGHFEPTPGHSGDLRRSVEGHLEVQEEGQSSPTDLTENALAQLRQTFPVDEAVTAAVTEAVAGMDAEAVLGAAAVVAELAEHSSDALDAWKRATRYIAECKSGNYMSAWRRATAVAA